MTLDEWVALHTVAEREADAARVRRDWRRAVAKAMAQGQPVPKEVIDCYERSLNAMMGKVSHSQKTLWEDR
jgi:hypothetical protein